MLLLLAALIPPALAATAAEEVTSAPLVAFGWRHDVLDPVFQYSSFGDDPTTGWVGGAAVGTRRDFNGTSWVATSAAGASISASFWGSDLYLWGEPSTANLTLTVNDVEVPDKRENRQVAYTNGIPLLAYTSVKLTVNSGFVNLTAATIRRYAYIANIPQGMYTGETMLGRSWWDLPVSAWRAVEEGAANGNLTTSGGWTVRTELGGVELPHLVGAAGASLAFNVPPRTTYLQLNGTATNTAARYSVSVSPDPLQGGPATSTISTRAWPHVVEYFGLPLDPGKEYAVTLTALEGDVGLQSVLFIGDDYTRRGEFTSTVPQGPNEGSAGGATTTSGDGSSGSSDGGSGTGRSGSGGSTGTTSDPETGSSADGGQGSKPNIGAIVGGVLGGVALLVAIALAIWRMRGRKNKRSTIYKGFEVDDAAPKPQPFYKINSGRSIEKSSQYDIALSPMTPQDPGASPHIGRIDTALSPMAPQDPRASPHIGRIETLQPPASPAVHSPDTGESYHPLSSAPSTAPTTPVHSSPASHSKAAVPTPALVPNAAEPKPERSTPASTLPRRERRRVPQLDEMQETDAGRIVAVAPPRYNPAWRDE